MDEGILDKLLYGVKVINDNILVLSDKLDEIRKELDVSGLLKDVEE